MNAPKVKIPQSPFVDATTGRVSREWLQWLLNPSFLSLNIDLSNVQGTLPVVNGGTGLITGNSGGILGFVSAGAMASSVTLTANGVVIGGGSGATPFSLAEASNGQLLIGKTGSPPALSTLTPGTGIGIINGAGSISVGINNTTVVAGTYGLTAAQTVSVTVNQQGQITSISATNISIANTQVTGLGTLSTQNANAVAIIGGTIDGTVIGGVTPAAGAFTNILSGTYTPTLTNVANLTGSTAFTCQWLRVGSSVTVSGRVDIHPTAATTSTKLGISLPVASNFATDHDCGGIAAATGVAGQVAAIIADSANDRAQLQYISADITNQPMYFQFTYQII